MLEVNIYNAQDKLKFVDEIRCQLKNPVFLCIGTEKVFADSLGPRVGTLLNDKMEKSAYVYGFSDQNITAENLQYSYEFVKAMHPNNQIVVIDAAVGSSEQIGSVQIRNGGIVPGAATNKNLPMVGDISIIGIVAEQGLADFYTLNSQKDVLVSTVANYIADALIQAQV